MLVVFFTHEIIRKHTASRSVFKQRSIYGISGEMDISHNGASDKDISDSTQVRVICFIQRCDIVQFEVEILVYRFECASNRKVVFKLG